MVREEALVAFLDSLLARMDEVADAAGRDWPALQVQLLGLLDLLARSGPAQRFRLVEGIWRAAHDRAPQLLDEMARTAGLPFRGAPGRPFEAAPTVTGPAVVSAAAALQTGLSEARHVNLEFAGILDDTSPRILAPHEGLCGAGAYRLTVSIGLLPDPRSARPGNRLPSRARRGKRSSSTLPSSCAAKGSGSSVRRLPGWCGPIKARRPRTPCSIWKRTIFSSRALPYSTAISTTSTAFSTPPASRWLWNPQGLNGPAPGAQLPGFTRREVRSMRSRLAVRFGALQRSEPRAVCLAVQPGAAADEYLITVFMGEAILPARVHISRSELTGHLVAARRAMDGLRREPLFVDGGYTETGEYTGDYRTARFNRERRRFPAAEIAESQTRFLSTMAFLGNRFYNDLFRSDSGRLVRAAIDRRLQTGGRGSDLAGPGCA